MKQSTLIENILSKDNLNNAYLQVVRNKGGSWSRRDGYKSPALSFEGKTRGANQRKYKKSNL